MEKRFTELYTQYYKWVCKIAYEMIKDYSLAQDISQNSFIKMNNDIAKIEEGKEKAWLYICVRNEAINCLRKKRKLEFYDPTSEEIHNTYYKEFFVADDLVERIYIKEFQKYLLNQVRQQNIEWYEILISTYYEGKESIEIAKELGITVGTLRSKAHRARKWIQAHLKEEYYKNF